MEIISPFSMEVNQFSDLNYHHLVYVGILGLCFGSFCHASALRIMLNKDIIFDKSRCDHCNKVLLWWHIIPVLGFILCFGRCHYCKERINFQNLTSELLVSILFVLYFIHFDTEYFIFFSIFSSLLMICFITDLNYMKLVLSVMLLIIIMGILFNTFHNINSFSSGLIFSVSGFLFGWILIFLINLIYFYYRKINGFGDGDKWLLGSIGSYLGVEQMLYIFIYSSILSAIFGIYILYINNSTIKTKVPFGAFICFVSFFMPLIAFYK